MGMCIIGPGCRLWLSVVACIHSPLVPLQKTMAARLILVKKYEFSVFVSVLAVLGVLGSLQFRWITSANPPHSLVWCSSMLLLLCMCVCAYTAGRLCVWLRCASPSPVLDTDCCWVVYTCCVLRCCAVCVICVNAVRMYVWSQDSVCASVGCFVCFRGGQSFGQVMC